MRSQTGERVERSRVLPRLPRRGASSRRERGRRRARRVGPRPILARPELHALRVSQFVWTLGEARRGACDARRTCSRKTPVGLVTSALAPGAARPRLFRKNATAGARCLAPLAASSLRSVVKRGWDHSWPCERRTCVGRRHGTRPIGNPWGGRGPFFAGWQARAVTWIIVRILLVAIGLWLAVFRPFLRICGSVSVVTPTRRLRRTRRECFCMATVTGGCASDQREK